MLTDLIMEHFSSSGRLCPVCAHHSSILVPDLCWQEWVIVECCSCHMIFLDNPPSQDLLMSEFAWEETAMQERARRRQGRRFYYFFSDSLKRLRIFLRSFRRHSKEIHYIQRYAQGARILDVGCGDGGTLRNLPEGYVPYGIEPSPGLCASANALFVTKGGSCIQDVAVSGLEKLGEGMRFDMIVMRSFLEHDSRAMETLQGALAVLAPRGAVLIKVPNIACWNASLRRASWPGMRYPDHVNYFTPQTLRQILRRAGFSHIHMPLLWRLPTSDNLWAIAFK